MLIGARGPICSNSRKILENSSFNDTVRTTRTYVLNMCNIAAAGSVDREFSIHWEFSMFGGVLFGGVFATSLFCPSMMLHNLS